MVTRQVLLYCASSLLGQWGLGHPGFSWQPSSKVPNSSKVCLLPQQTWEGLDLEDLHTGSSCDRWRQGRPPHQQVEATRTRSSTWRRSWRCPLWKGPAAIKFVMVELFSSEDNSSGEEELVKQVNTVESSKGGGMRRLARIVMGCCLTWVPRPRRWPRHR